MGVDGVKDGSKGTEQNNKCLIFGKRKESFCLSIFIPDDFQNYPEKDATEKRSRIKELVKKSGLVSNSDDQKWI